MVQVYVGLLELEQNLAAEFPGPKKANILIEGLHIPLKTFWFVVIWE